MRKKFKTSIALIMTTAMVFGLAGCSKSDKKDATDAKATEATEDTKDTSADDTDASTKDSSSDSAAGMDGWKAFDEKVTLTVPVYDRSLDGLPAVDDNYWTQWVQSEFGDKYNIEVKYVAIPRTDVMTKYSMLIAGEETPTIMMEYDYPKVSQWASDGAMQTIDLDAFAEVAPTYYQKMVDNDQIQYTTVNGDTYFVLSERPYYETTYTYVNFVRKDWLDEVGLDIPKNYEEQVAAIKAIQDAGLCGDYTVPLGLPDKAYVANFTFRDIPVDESEWAMHSSLSTPSLSWDPTYKLLKRQNAEYNEGWYSTEYDLNAGGFDGATDNQAKTDFINGKLYSLGGYMSSEVEWLKAFYENNPDAELALASPFVVEEPGVVDDTQIRADNPFGIIIGFSSYADEDQLKAAWMYMEWMCQEDTLFTLENGVEGLTYELDENGLPVVIADYTGKERLNNNCNIDMVCIVHASKTIGTIEDSIAAIAPQGLPQDFEQMMLDNYYSLREIADAGNAYSDPVFGVEILSESEYSATLLSLYQEYSVKLTKCDPAEFDALYEEYSKLFLDAGYQEIMDERLAAYEDGNTTKLPQ